MKAWDEPETKEEIRDYVEVVINRVKTFHELRVGHLARSKASPLGEEQYLNNEMSLLINKGIDMGQYSGGVLVGAWIKQGFKKLPNLAKFVTDYMFERIKDHEDYDYFTVNIERFLLIYFQWEKLDSLLSEFKKADWRGINYNILLGICRNDEKDKMLISELMSLEQEIGLSDPKKCNGVRFAAVCYHIMKFGHNRFKPSEKYIPDDNFERFRNQMADCFNRGDVKSANAGKANNYLKRDEKRKIIPKWKILLYSTFPTKYAEKQSF